MFQTDGPLMRAQQPAFQQRDDPLDARQQFRRVALGAQDRDLTSVAFAVERQVAQPTIRLYHAARRNEPQHALQTEGADAILLAGHPPQSVEPHLHRGARVLKNRPRSQRSLVRAVRTLPERRTQPPRPAFPTPGAAEPFRPAHPEKIVTTGFLRSEAPFEVRQRARIVFHGLLHYLLWLPESNGYPLSCKFIGGGTAPMARADEVARCSSLGWAPTVMLPTQPPSVGKLPRCGINYISSGANCENASGAASSNRVNRLRNTNLTMSVGPFRCFAIRSSVSSLSSGVAPALKKCGR